MIEIEVEMDVEVPAAEVQGIEAQISRLMEVICPEAPASHLGVTSYINLSLALHGKPFQSL